jgi:hypothetical protein
MAEMPVEDLIAALKVANARAEAAEASLARAVAAAREEGLAWAQNAVAQFTKAVDERAWAVSGAFACAYLEEAIALERTISAALARSPDSAGEGPTRGNQSGLR